MSSPDLGVAPDAGVLQLSHEGAPQHDHEGEPQASLPRALLSLGAVAVVALCTIWLATTGRLGLYINPRYLVFTVVLACLAIAGSIAAGVVVLRSPGGARAHADDDPGHPAPDARPPLARGGALIAAVVVVALAVAMLALPPATLSARTAAQRTVNSTSFGSAQTSTSSLGDTAKFGVKDWATAISSSTNSSDLIGRPLTLSGFVVRTSSSTGFTLTRFVISCCAVDAQPVGVGVQLASGETMPKSGAWVRVKGALIANPDVTSTQRLVIEPTTLAAIAKPTDPYEY